ncbi:hypothetical protein [Nocardioides antri]|nr:hypothetical protein [Nocardioides antri]
MEWFPLVHPGLLKGKEDRTGAKRRGLEAHDGWCRAMKDRWLDAGQGA